MVAALKLGWRSPTPLRPPDLTLAAADWTWFGDGVGLVTPAGYRVHLTRSDARAWATAGRRFGDGEIELRLRSLAPAEDVGVGLLWRYQDAANHYLFAIGGDGYYTVALVRAGELIPLRPWQQWPHVHRGVAVNRLRVRCRGPVCRFFINDEFTAEVTDATFLSGDVGLWAQTFSDPALDVAFEEMRVWQADKGPKTKDEEPTALVLRPPSFVAVNAAPGAERGKRWCGSRIGAR
jgi:hypothetical protein